MLPRHLRSFVVAQRVRSLEKSSRAFHLPFRIPSGPQHPSQPCLSFSDGRRSFHSSYRRQNELPKSPFQTFVEVLRDELRKNRELQDNVKQLQGDVDKLQDSEALKRAREMYERARVRIPAFSL